MTIADVLIVYLAFGAPVAVYRYFQYRQLQADRRIVATALTLLFWVPVALHLVYRYLRNAYSTGTFGSLAGSDSSAEQLSRARQQIFALLIRADIKMSPASVREILERYVGLTMAQGSDLNESSEAPLDLFLAAGMTNSDLATVCLSRRNRRKIDKHQKAARRDFVGLFEVASINDPVATREAITAGLDLAERLNDKKAVDALNAIAAQYEDEVWNSDAQHTLANV